MPGPDDAIAAGGVSRRLKSPVNDAVTTL